LRDILPVPTAPAASLRWGARAFVNLWRHWSPKGCAGAIDARSARTVILLFIVPERTFERSDPRFRSGQTRERIPSNAWAKKIATPTKPMTAVIVSNIANALYATARQKTAVTLHSQKKFLGTNTQSGSTEDSAQQTCIVL
jgi:hypothetical protein